MNILDALLSTVKPFAAPAYYSFAGTGSDATVVLSAGRWLVTVEGTGGTDYATLNPGVAFTAQTAGTVAGTGIRVGAGFQVVIDASPPTTAGAKADVTWHFTGAASTTRINFTKIQ